MEITLEQAENAIAHVLAENPGRTNAPICAYVNDLDQPKPHCVIGNVLFFLGVTVDELVLLPNQQLNTNKADMEYALRRYGFEFTPAAFDYLARIQELADDDTYLMDDEYYSMYRTWEQAVKEATA